MLIGRGPELARLEPTAGRGPARDERRAHRSRARPASARPRCCGTPSSSATGMTVLQAKGVESEAEIPFAGLYALLRPAFDGLDALPRPPGGGAQGCARALARRRERPLPDRRGHADPAGEPLRARAGPAGDRRRPLDRRLVAERGPVRRPAPARRRARARDRHPPRPRRSSSRRSSSAGLDAGAAARCSSATPAARSRRATPNASTRPRWATRSRSSNWPAPTRPS